MAASLAERIDILTCVTLVYILQYVHLNGVYFSQEYHAVEPKAEAVTLLDLHLYTPAPGPVFVSDPSIYRTRPLLSSRLNLLCHSHLLGNLTIIGLLCVHLGIIMSVPICRMDSCSVS